MPFVCQVARISSPLDRVLHIYVSPSYKSQRQTFSLWLCPAAKFLIPSPQMTLRDAFHHIRQVRPIIYPNAGFRRELLGMDQTLTPETKPKVEHEMMVQCLCGLGLVFPQVWKARTAGSVAAATPSFCFSTRRYWLAFCVYPSLPALLSKENGI